LKAFKADLHIHTCLSPCADLEMSPQKIARQAKFKELDILGICDHNSAENTPAVVKAAGRFDILVLPGLEITSQEEVHVLALFDKVESALALQEHVYSHLPGENDEKTFGMQVVVDAEGVVISFNHRLLIGASTLTLEAVVDAIHFLGGLAIASHIDREGFSLLGHLGFVPDHLSLDALEISADISYGQAQNKFQPRQPLIASSDAHFLKDIGKAATTFLLKSGTVDEIKKAFLNERGRAVIH